MYCILKKHFLLKIIFVLSVVVFLDRFNCTAQLPQQNIRFFIDLYMQTIVALTCVCPLHVFVDAYKTYVFGFY